MRTRGARITTGVATMLAASTLFIVACGGVGDNDDNGGVQALTGAGAPAEEKSLPGPSAANPDAFDASNTVSGSGQEDAGAGLLDRKIIFSADMALTVGDVPGAFAGVGRIAMAAGGFVEKSTFSDADGDTARQSAMLTLRVPASNYQDALADLRELPGATVRTESSRSTEVTEQYTDLQSRLRNLERTEQQYLALLEQAKTIQDILTVQDRLDSVRLQIEQIQGRLNVLDDLADLATIGVTLSPVPAKADSDGGPKSVGEAFADAWAWFTEASQYALAGVAVLAVGAIFLAIPAALVATIVMVLSRRKGTSAV